MDSIQSFHSPPPEYSACAFWFWNGVLSPARMLWQMDEMKDKGIYNAFMHARAYLKTPYMGEDWFQVMDACISHARDIGFYPWLYDEYAWPSGTCGSTFAHGMQAPSRVLRKGRVNMAKGLEAEIIAGKPDENRRLIAACPLAGGQTMAFYERIYETAVDYLNPDTIRDFIDCTHEVYLARYGKDFGGLIPGIFFDEIYLAGHPLSWTDRLPSRFRETYGYDLLSNLPALIVDDYENAQQVRKDYYALLASMYEQAFFAQIAQWCSRHNLQLTGHTEEDLRHHPRRQGNYFRTMRHLHIPGADCHDYRYRFPREISMHEPKYAVSVARLYHKPRAMSEAMGGAGWGCSLQEYKRGINALGAAGINMFILHGFYNECEHQGSQADWPASFFYQNPYWKYFRQFADYIHRISYINSLGEAIVDVGLYYPLAEISAHTAAGDPDNIAVETDRQYHRVLNAFLESQIDIDLIDRDSLTAATVDNGRLCTGSQRFKLLIFPANIQLNETIYATLQQLAAQGGMVLFYPVQGSTVPDGFIKSAVCKPEAMPKRFCAVFPRDAEVIQGRTDKLYISHRRIGRQDVYMLASTLAQPRQLRIALRGQGALQKLSPETGDAMPVPFIPENGRLLTDIRLDADEACFVLTNCSMQPIPSKLSVRQAIALDGDWSFLPLDSSYDTTWSIDARESTLALPLAQLTDIQTGHTDPIRIRNTAQEPGHCGRHISLWDASWLGRRVGWGDDADKQDLYFIKTLKISNQVHSARICIAAVNRFTLYVNGQKAAQEHSGGKPVTLDITGHLQTGHNLLAVHVHTDTPLQSRELTQAEAIPTDALASLLLQGEIQTESELISLLSDASWAVASQVQPEWIQQEPARIQTVDPASVTCHVAPDLQDSDFVYAWERGRPPILPWGDIPLFGKAALYPRDIRYSVQLPAGATRVYTPAVAGAYSTQLDGKPALFKDGFMKVPPDGALHTLSLGVTVSSPTGGLLDALRVHILPQPSQLAPWQDKGLAWFAGRALYRKTLHIQKEPGRNYLLDLGRVCFYAEIWVNGTLCQVRTWQPYQADITVQLLSGANEIAVIVANSAACQRRHMLVDEGMALAWNRYWNEDNIDREPQNLSAGLLGPVQLLITASV